jgi:hypothetical protein
MAATGAMAPSTASRTSAEKRHAIERDFSEAQSLERQATARRGRPRSRAATATRSPTT